MSILWSVFRTAVHKAIEEREAEIRDIQRTRSLSRIASALENLVANGTIPPDYYPMPPPQGAPKP